MKWRTLKQVERDYIDLVMTSVGGCISSAARILGLQRRSLQRKLTKLGGQWRHAPNEKGKPKPEQEPVLDHQVAAWLGSHIYWPIKERVNWRLQPWSHEMMDLIEQYEREAKGFTSEV